MSHVSSFKNNILIQKYAATDKYYKNLKSPRRKFTNTNNDPSINPLSRNTLDGYVKNLFDHARHGGSYTGSYYTNYIKSILDVYNILLSVSIHFKVDLLDVIFNSKFKEQPLELAPVVYKEGDCIFLEKNLERIAGYIISPQYRTSVKFLYMNLTIDINGIKHKNILIVDTESLNIYRIEPHGSGTFRGRPNLNAKINTDLGKHIATTTYFKYSGELYKKTKCPNTMGIQTNLRGGYCVTYSLFLTYLLTRYDQGNLSKFLRGEHIDTRSYIYRFEHMGIPQQRYIFAHFLEKVFFIFYDKLSRYPDQQEFVNKRIDRHILQTHNIVIRNMGVKIYRHKQSLLPMSKPLRYTIPEITYDPHNLAIDYHPERNKHLSLNYKKKHTNAPSPPRRRVSSSPTKKRQKVKH